MHPIRGFVRATLRQSCMVWEQNRLTRSLQSIAPSSEPSTRLHDGQGEGNCRLTVTLP